MDPKILRNAALAYEAVYNQEMRQEVEEQQDFENWVNSLVEEGYDLSEYTWEEMYETYITEIGVNFGGQAAVDKVRAKSAAERASAAKINAARTQRFGSGGSPSAGKDSSGNLRKPAPSAARPSGGAPAARPAASAPASRPAATPAARPAASASTAKPAPAAAKPAGSAMDQWAKANPRLAQAQKIRQQGGSRAEVNKSLYNKGTAASSSTPTVVKSSFDMFDVVKGYLIDEGYAETEQAAIAIMANMSEEWRDVILDEAMTNYEKNRKRAAQRAAARNDARAQGKTGAVPGVGYVTPRKERETWTDESGKTRHAKGL
jgi:hypothetical protein